MARQRTKDTSGKFVGDDPATPNVDEAWVDAPADPLEDVQVDAPVPAPVPTQPNPTMELSDLAPDPATQPTPEPQPAQVELKTSETSQPVNQLTPESIQVSVQEKLSNRLNSPESDPFVPSSQLSNEVKEVSRNDGFELTRGTEAGARLIAKARRGA
jgi:hypothetical protein